MKSTTTRAKSRIVGVTSELPELEEEDDDVEGEEEDVKEGAGAVARDGAA